MSITEKFLKLGTDDAPGQEARQSADGLAAQLVGKRLDGRPVDFSHGDVDAHEPAPGAFDAFAEGVARGGTQAYTEYRGDRAIRGLIGERLAAFTGAPVDADEGLIITPGTQGALFLAVAATTARGDRIAIVQPDYFANRKLAAFFEARIRTVRMDYLGNAGAGAGLDLDQLEEAFPGGDAGLPLFQSKQPRRRGLFFRRNRPHRGTGGPLRRHGDRRSALFPPVLHGNILCPSKGRGHRPGNGCHHHGPVQDGIAERLSVGGGFRRARHCRANGKAAGHRLASRRGLFPGSAARLVRRTGGMDGAADRRSSGHPGRPAARVPGDRWLCCQNTRGRQLPFPETATSAPSTKRVRQGAAPASRGYRNAGNRIRAAHRGQYTAQFLPGSGRGGGGD